AARRVALRRRDGTAPAIPAGPLPRAARVDGRGVRQNGGQGAQPRGDVRGSARGIAGGYRYAGGFRGGSEQLDLTTRSGVLRTARPLRGSIYPSRLTLPGALPECLPLGDRRNNSPGPTEPHANH